MTNLRRLFAWLLPWPWVSLLVLLVWLLLNQSASPGQLLIGLILALTTPRMLTALEAPPMRLRRPLALFRLLGNVIPDIIVSNYKVARAILFSDPERRPGFIHVPLAVTSPWSLSMLACILTATPGTCWVSYNRATGALLMHVVDLDDAGELEAWITHRYVRWLKEAFE